MWAEMERVAPPSSALRAPSPIKGEGEVALSRYDQSIGPSFGPSPLMGEGGRRPDEGGATIARARSLRRNRTEAEARLWGVLRDRRLLGFKFRRQVPIGRYVVDFVCFDARLVVEVDGSQHFESARDVRRDAELKARGFEVLRVWNNELWDNRDGVLEGVLAALVRRTGRGMGAERVAPPSSALRAPSPIEGEGDAALSRPAPNAEPSSGPSPLIGEGGRSPDEGGAA
jgi:very-short-patch-repair endonuclease